MKKMKKLSVVLGAGVVLVGLMSQVWAAASGSPKKGANPNGKPFVELAGQILEVEGEISSLQDQIDSLVGRVDSLEAMQAALATAITDLQATNVTLQAQIDTNTDDVASLEAQIASLHAANAALQNEIDSLGDTDGVLQAQIDANAAQITTLALSIDTLRGDLQASIDNNNTLINAMQQQIDQIAVELVEKQNRVDGYCPDGSAIQQILEDGSVICENASSGSTGMLQSFQSFGAIHPSDGWASVYATCPSDTVVTGCGHHGHDVQLNNVYISDNTCYIDAYSRIHFSARAFCLRLTP